MQILLFIALKKREISFAEIFSNLGHLPKPTDRCGCHCSIFVRWKSEFMKKVGDEAMKLTEVWLSSQKLWVETEVKMCEMWKVKEEVWLSSEKLQVGGDRLAQVVVTESGHEEMKNCCRKKLSLRATQLLKNSTSKEYWRGTDFEVSNPSPV